MMPGRSPAATAFAALSRDESALERVLELGMADEPSVQAEPRPTLAMIAATARDQMLHWVLPTGLPDGSEDNLIYFTAVFATHYVAAMEILVETKDEHLSVALSVRLDTFSALEAKAALASKPGISRTLRAQSFAAEIVSDLLGSWMAIAVTSHGALDAEHASVAATGVANLVFLYELRSLLSEELPLAAQLAERLASATAPALIKAINADDRPSHNVASVGYHALNAIDLEGLASRRPSLREKYGMSIERAFERQLSLLFTSFGYAVIESVPGKRQVDLLCVTASPAPATFVVEAKTTTASHYTLPATHERALDEHVNEVKRNLRGLPPLKLILVVAPAFSKGAARRLEAVGRRHGVGCYGVPVHVLALLRIPHLGEIPSDVFYDEITGGPTIASEDTAMRIIRIVQSPATGWKEFVAIQRRARERP
jgi:hypothetical protein